MSLFHGFPVNFSISPAAREAIERLRRECPFPADIVGIGWGYLSPAQDGDEGLPAIGFYPPEDRPGLEHLLEIVDGVELVYAITGKDYHRLEGMMLHFAPERAFFVEPAPLRTARKRPAAGGRMARSGKASDQSPEKSFSLR